MGWDGSGNINLLHDFSADRDSGAPDHFIDADKVDDLLDDLGEAIEKCININGETTVAANIPFGNNRITGLGAATAKTDAAQAQQVADNSLQYGGTTGGTADAQTATMTFLSAVASGTRLLLLAGAGLTNTGACTLNVNVAGATNIKLADGSTDPAAGDITAGYLFEVIKVSSNFQLVWSASPTWSGGLVTSQFIKENSAAASDIAGFGQIWVKDDTPNKLKFTDDAGSDFTVGMLEATNTWSGAQSFSAAMSVGVDDDTPGRINVYGGGASENGALIYLYQPSDEDTSQEYYRFRAEEGSLYVENSDSDVLAAFLNDDSVAFQTGTVDVGVSDDTPGRLNLRGGGAGESAGSIYIYNDADNDGTIDYYRILGSGGHLNLENSGGNSLMRALSSGEVAFRNGTVQVGVDDDTPGLLSLFGGGTGEAGGAVRLYNDADNDGSVDYYSIDTTSGNLKVGRDGGSDLTLDTNGTLTVKGAKTSSDDDGTQSSGTYTPTPDGGNIKKITNGGSFTLGVPSEVTTLIVQVTNNGSAGTITTSSYTVVDGDALTTTNGDDFLLFIIRTADFSYLTIKALQ